MADYENEMLPRGRLEKLWLGGLVNPAAFLMSLKLEKAISCDCPLEKVYIEIYSSDRAYSTARDF